MYYEEAIVNGVLSRRYSSDGEWEPFTAKELTDALDKIKMLNGQVLRRIEKAPS